MEIMSTSGPIASRISWMACVESVSLSNPVALPPLAERGEFLTISISLMLAYRSSGCLLSSNVDPLPLPPVASVASPQPKTPARSATPKTPFPVHAGAESPPAAEPGSGFAAVVALPVLANLRVGFAVIDNAGEDRGLAPLQETAARRPRAQAGGRALQADLTDMQATGLGAAAEYHKLGL